MLKTVERNVATKSPTVPMFIEGFVKKLQQKVKVKCKGVAPKVALPPKKKRHQLRTLHASVVEKYVTIGGTVLLTQRN